MKIKMVRCGRFTYVLVALAISGLPAPAAIIYQENFDGANSTLTGTVPDIDNYAGGSNAWQANNDGLFQEDGDVVGSGNAGVWLPFQPVAGNVYTLSADFTLDEVANSQWLSIGFSSGNGNTHHNSTTASGYGWALLRENDGNGQFFAGPILSTPNGAFADPGGTVNIKIILDASDSDTNLWGIEWRVNDGLVGQAVPPALSGRDFEGNITHVGFGKLVDASGSIDNFLLTDGGEEIYYIPEPSSAILFFWGMAFVHRLSRLYKKT